jgi:hypothetical protein
MAKGVGINKKKLRGATPAVHEPETDDPNMKTGDPTGRGAVVGPTKLAEERERTRHALQRQMGQTAAGEQERLKHGLRKPGVTREALREAEKEADRRVIGHEVPTQTQPK